MVLSHFHCIYSFFLFVGTEHSCMWFYSLFYSSFLCPLLQSFSLHLCLCFLLSYVWINNNKSCTKCAHIAHTSNNKKSCKQKQSGDQAINHLLPGVPYFIWFFTERRILLLFVLSTRHKKKLHFRGLCLFNLNLAFEYMCDRAVSWSRLGSLMHLNSSRSCHNCDSF